MMDAFITIYYIINYYYYIYTSRGKVDDAYSAWCWKVMAGGKDYYGEKKQKVRRLSTPDSRLRYGFRPPPRLMVDCSR